MTKAKPGTTYCESVNDNFKAFDNQNHITIKAESKRSTIAAAQRKPLRQL